MTWSNYIVNNTTSIVKIAYKISLIFRDPEETEYQWFGMNATAGILLYEIHLRFGINLNSPRLLLNKLIPVHILVHKY